MHNDALSLIMARHAGELTASLQNEQERGGRTILRTQRRQPRPAPRRQGTRLGAVRAALREV